MLKVKILLLLSLMLFVVTASPRRGHLTGDARKLNGKNFEKAEELLKSSLAILAAGEMGPNYRLHEITTATRQVVAGSKYVFNAILIDEKDEHKNCIVKIWSQAWLENGIKVSFKCDGEEELVRQHSAPTA